MVRSFTLILVGLVAAFWAAYAMAQSAADACLQQGFRPGSAAYHACISEAENQGFGMFDPLDGDRSEAPEKPQDPGDASVSGDSTTRWIQQLDRLDSDTASDDTASSGWNWSGPAK
jgi:hypothetical protein